MYGSARSLVAMVLAQHVSNLSNLRSYGGKIYVLAGELAEIWAGNFNVLLSEIK